MANNEQLRIDNLLSTGKITEEDHKILTAALGNQKSIVRRLMSFLINPFESISSGTALLIGGALAIAMSFLGSRIGVYLPGALDLQIAQEGKRFYAFSELLLQNTVAVLTVAGVFLGGALILKQRNLRLVDFLGFVALSRLPYALFILVLFLLGPIFPGLLPRTTDAAKGGAIVALAILSITVLAWQMVLMFSAQKDASGLKGKLLWISFVFGLVVAEAISYGLNFIILK